MSSKTPEGKPIVHIDDWAVTGSIQDSYQAPEQAYLCLTGKVYEHPRHQSGKRIVSSRIGKSQGCTVETDNTHYVLGYVNEGYKKWLDSVGIGFDELNPIKLGTGSLKEK